MHKNREQPVVEVLCELKMSSDGNFMKSIKSFKSQQSSLNSNLENYPLQRLVAMINFKKLKI